MLKNTKTRTMVRELLNKSQTPLSASDIFDILKDKNITLSSIYRTLDTFYQHKIISKETTHENISVYSIIKENHKHYLKCKKCQKTITLDYCPYHKTNESIRKNHFFVVDEHNVVIYGICKDCIK